MRIILGNNFARTTVAQTKTCKIVFDSNTTYSGRYKIEIKKKVIDAQTKNIVFTSHVIHKILPEIWHVTFSAKISLFSAKTRPESSHFL